MSGKRALCALLLWLPLPSAQAKERITWAVFDWAPVYILQNPDAVQVAQLNDGTGDRLVKLLQHSLPQYEHRMVNMVPGRIFAELRNGTHLCYASSLANADRLAYSVMTAAGIAPPVQVVLRQDTLRAHPQWRDGVDLAQLFQDRSLLGNYPAARSFGDEIDTLLRSPSNRNMKPMAVVSQSSNLFRMMQMGRLDYTLEYPQVLVYQQSKGQAPADLVSVPIKNAPPFLGSHVACSKNDWGRKVIVDIDAAMQKIAAQPSYLQALEAWVPPNEMALRHKDYENFVRQRSSRSMILSQ
ncbi:TIGR02285 family protein [Amantichitinum ursilacus]|uniref:TIGR02285 family protein n=1 Tax=Amantichitinum ursilacus TaxID=857265 RepID=A0A0N1JTP0_9NEIS|nr:TIGR02285 family protein [Amantichitinum ursilacus]KPC54774.1 hypothetical protein WG78_04355 [Amantichitinum ursilacus]